MQHLYNTIVKVQRLQANYVDGSPTYAWVDEPGQLTNVHCRIDLNFIRIGKDAPMAVEAGKAPDRTGVVFYNNDVPIRAGDRLVCLPNDFGELPVSGTFEVRAIPDTASGYSSAHHIEVQVFEVNQALTGFFPGVVP